MNNKDAIEHLKSISIYSNTLAHWERVAIDKAIASLEAWDRIEEDIKHSQFMFLSGDKEVECIPIFEVMNIINRNLSGEVMNNADSN